MKAFFVGIGIVVTTLLISVFSDDLTLLYKITGGVAIASLVMSASISGAFIDGDRFGGNVLSEIKEDRKERFILTNRLLLIGLPNALTAILVYFLM
ncbi:DUF5316 domain-containing protein [Domibacillus sp. A3M-37]|uniref:DUF5316 domain-containing protein n=1 Tax=Domibacillus sp. A3M-37 TaxID=2962037 RepID=UPI0020B79AAC|nr:DUF5316 domain-containing protein [Domibacillus sp. A3M-37]MCP3764217.1 DUF5316 domain-containing protein [Domibacillus sp. A3M-37]